jgi:hypothetical protein
LCGGEPFGDVGAFGFGELLGERFVRFAGIAADRLRYAERCGVAACYRDAALCNRADCAA